MKHTPLLVGVLILILGACARAQPAISEPPSTLPPTLVTLEGSPTSTLTPVEAQTDTPSPTVEIAPSETQVPVVIPTLPPLTLVTVRPTETPSRARIPTDTPTATTDLPPSETPFPTPTLACERETASVVLSASSENVQVGDTIKVTVTVNNEGCVILGLPQYRLYVRSDGNQSIFTPENPEPVVHYLGVGLGQSDAAEFELIAVAGGQATLTATVSYEVHLGYPGPAYWGMTATREPLSITVIP